MKKIKWSIMILAIVLSIGSAFASRECQICQGATQYYFYGGAYWVAGKIGVSYICNHPEDSYNTCTYYKVGNNYIPCQVGFYCDDRVIYCTP